MSNVNKWLKRHKELETETNFGDVNYVKLKEGPNVLRIIPSKEPREDFWMEVVKSFNVGPNSKVVTRPSQYGLPDPVSDLVTELKAKVDGEGKPDAVAHKRADAMKGKKRAMMWVIVRAEEEKGYQLFDTNLIVLKNIIGVMVDAEYGDITDADEGTDITINYVPGTKKSFPKWTIVPRRNNSPLGHPEALKEDLFDRHKIGEPSEVDYIKACLEGSEGAYIEAKKAARNDRPSQPAAPVAPSTAPAGDEEAAMEKELARIRAAKAAKANAPTAPAPPAPAVPGTSTALLNADWWAVIGGETKQVKGTDVQGLVDQGHSNLALMAYPQGDWTTADAAGFIKAGAAAPPPPPSSQVGADLEEALG